MANTYTLIQSQTLASTIVSVTFSSIPGTYTDLVLKSAIRTTGGSVAERVDITFNASTSGYSSTRLVGSGSASSSGRLSSQPAIPSYYDVASSATANTFSNGELYIPSYTASQNKPMSESNVTENNATLAYITALADLWSNTAAITSMTLTDGSGGLFAIGSSFYLYGIKNS